MYFLLDDNTMLLVKHFLRNCHNFVSMKNTLIPILLFCLPISLISQLTDDFSDGDFTNNPSWIGQTDNFQINNEELQLNDSAAGSNNSSYLALSAPTSNEDPTVWEFLVKLTFAPSASNYAIVYLNASQADLSADLNGYYVRIGGISGSDDAVELFRQDGASSTRLLSGTVGAVGGSQPLARIKVVRTEEGAWTLEADYTGGTNFQLEGMATDDTYPMGTYFGFVCNYTSSRSSNFFFDDVRIDPIFQDNIPPSLSGAAATASNTVELEFNEPVQVPNNSSVSIDGGIGNPTNISAGSTPNHLQLTLGNMLVNQQSYSVTVEGIQDVNGNAGGMEMANFTFFNIQTAEENDIIVTEIMADPNPAIGLPEAEFVELYNRSDKVIQLSTLGLSTGGSPKSLPDINLLPDSYIIVCDEDEAAAFETFGAVAAIPSFPSLTNGGDDVLLVDEDGNTIFQVSYSSAWYQDFEKASGGYTLELIQNDGPYICSGNWRASEDPAGGTPGKVNSLAGTAPDTEGPSLIQAVAVSDFEVIVVFNEELDPAVANNVANYTIEPALPINFVSLQSPENKQVVLILNGAVQEGTVYTIRIGNEITDCIGNPIGNNNSIQFGLTVTPEPGDIVINELLFNPATGGKDFVELYNRSDKIFNLRNLRLGNLNLASGNIGGPIESDFLLFPEGYVVITEEPGDILNRYDVPSPFAMIKNSLPSLPDDEGNITLATPSNVVIDSFQYDKDLHSPLLDDVNGVSLERISPDRPTNESGNWHSAAATVGFATPTYKNSQLIDTTQAADNNDIIFLPNPRFSPDSDGFEDVLLIQYEVEKPGFVMNLHVFDAQGRLIHRLVRNEILATSGSFKWDGSINLGEKARTGIYVLWAEIFQPDGGIRRQKEVFVLAGQLGQ